VTVNVSTVCAARGARNALGSRAGITVTSMLVVSERLWLSITVRSNVKVVGSSTLGAVKLAVVRVRVIRSILAGALHVQSSSGPSGSSLSRAVSRTSAPSRTLFDAPLFTTSARAIGGRFELEPTLLPPDPLLQPASQQAASAATVQGPRKDR